MSRSSPKGRHKEAYTSALRAVQDTHPATSTLRLRQLLRVIAALNHSLPSRAPPVPSDAPLPLARRLLPRWRAALIRPRPIPSRTSALSKWRLTS